SYMLTNTGNSVGTLAANTGSGGGVTFAQTGGLSIGSVNGVNGVNTGTLSLTTGGTVAQSAPIIATNLALIGNGGATFTLTDGGNNVATLAASTSGAVTFAQTGGLSIGSVNGVNGVNTGTLSLTSGGAVTQSAPIVATNL